MKLVNAAREAAGSMTPGGLLDKFWLIAGGGIVLWVALDATATIQPGQVAVRINNITGGQVVLTEPGWVVRLPLSIHTIEILDVSPQTFLMGGTQDIDDLHVAELTVRASDGSNFHFSDTTLIYQLIGDQAIEAIADAGTQYGYRSWIKPLARSIMRDEFGRESTITVSDPTSYGQAAARARDRLNEVLSHHGVLVTQIVTPRPKFNDEYEKLIEERNRLSNELDVIESNLARAETDRERVLAEVDRDQNKVIQERRAALESELATATAIYANAIREADTYRIEKVGRGQADLSASLGQAQELRGQREAQYRSRKAEIDAFRNQPVERVMERLGERIAGIVIDIQPWTNDANPSRVTLDQNEATP